MASRSGPAGGRYAGIGWVWVWVELGWVLMGWGRWSGADGETSVPEVTLSDNYPLTEQKWSWVVSGLGLWWVVVGWFGLGVGVVVGCGGGFGWGWGLGCGGVVWGGGGVRLWWGGFGWGWWEKQSTRSKYPITEQKWHLLWVTEVARSVFKLDEFVCIRQFKNYTTSRASANLNTMPSFKCISQSKHYAIIQVHQSI